MAAKAPAQRHTTPTYTTAVIRAMNIHLVHLTTSTASQTGLGPVRLIHAQSKVYRLRKVSFALSSYHDYKYKIKSIEARRLL